jgi:hypothetical protein
MSDECLDGHATPEAVHVKGLRARNGQKDGSGKDGRQEMAGVH